MSHSWSPGGQLICCTTMLAVILPHCAVRVVGSKLPLTSVTTLPAVMLTMQLFRAPPPPLPLGFMLTQLGSAVPLTSRLKWPALNPRTHSMR